MRVLSLFSGVGGFDLGLEQAGWRTVFQCEIDKHCQQTLAHHWPDVPRWDDVSTLTGRHILDNCDGVDVVAWGSPCQDLSVAGKRAGLSGERSGLFHQGIRIIKELRELTNGRGPVWSIWENVAGALSSNGGADFGQVLYEMDEAGACFSEWAVLDAQHFGVPQRRRRVFVVSCFDSAIGTISPEPLLPVAESGSRDSTKGKPARKTTTGEVASSLRVGSGIGERGDGTDNLVVGDVAGCLRSGGEGGIPSSRGEHLVVGTGFRMQSFGEYTDDETASSLKMRDYKDATDLVVEAYDEYNDTLGGDTHHALRAGTRQSTGVLVEAAGFYESGPGYFTQTNVAGTLREGGGGTPPNSVIQGETMHVRRLTPLECERLMGWPDNHTLPRADGKTNSDTTRYKMCGNGVASPVARWIAEQINAVT